MNIIFFPGNPSIFWSHHLAFNIKVWNGRKVCTWIWLHHVFNPFPLVDAFWHISNSWFLKTLWQKENLLIMINFSFCHNVFNSFLKLNFYTCIKRFCIFVSRIFQSCLLQICSMLERVFIIVWYCITICKRKKQNLNALR